MTYLLFLLFEATKHFWVLTLQNWGVLCHWVFYEVLGCGRTVLTENVVKWTGNQELTACIADLPIDTSSVWDPQNLDPRSCFLEKSGSELPE
jgi:hypothetical protein